MGNVRWTVDPRATVALRFDDDDFIAALKTAEGDFRDKLESLLGGPPEAADFSDLVGDGVVIHARAGITGREDDDLGNRAQQSDARRGIKVDVAAANAALWGVWVTTVEDEAGSVPEKLASRNQATRESAYLMLPATLKDVLMARLQVHIRDAKRGAMRDPAQTKARAEGNSRAPTWANADGQPVTVQLASE